VLHLASLVVFPLPLLPNFGTCFSVCLRNTRHLSLYQKPLPPYSVSSVSERSSPLPLSQIYERTLLRCSFLLSLPSIPPPYSLLLTVAPTRAHQVKRFSSLPQHPPSLFRLVILGSFFLPLMASPKCPHHLFSLPSINTFFYERERIYLIITAMSNSGFFFSQTPRKLLHVNSRNIHFLCCFTPLTFRYPP